MCFLVVGLFLRCCVNIGVLDVVFSCRFSWCVDVDFLDVVF